MKHTKTFSDGGTAAANDVMGDKSAVDHSADGLMHGRIGERNGARGRGGGKEMKETRKRKGWWTTSVDAVDSEVEEENTESMREKEGGRWRGIKTQRKGERWRE